MNISRIFILRPIATSLLMVALLLSGLLAYHYLPMAALPQIDYPTIQVQTLYPGASSEVMAAVVTSPLERQLGTMSGLVQMTSLSSAGASVITLQFDLSGPPSTRRTTCCHPTCPTRRSTTRSTRRTRPS